MQNVLAEPAQVVITPDIANPAAIMEDAFNARQNVLILGDNQLEKTIVDAAGNDINIRMLKGHLTLAPGVNQAFNFTNTAPAVLPVLSISNTEHDFSGQGVKDKAVAIEVPGHSFAKGDIGKIFSDDLLSAQHNSGERKGEYFIVGDVSGDFIYIPRFLVETYSANIKVVKPNRPRIKIEGVSVSYSGTVTSSGIQLSGYINPEVTGCHIKGFNGPGINAIGCAFGHFKNNSIGDLSNEGTFVGYGINDSSGYENQTHGNHFYFCRHGYTDNVETTSADDDNWTRRGRSIRGSICHNHAPTCWAGVDTHPGHFAPTIDGNIISGSTRGRDTSGAGIQIRCEKAIVTNNKILNCKVGIDIKRSNGETGDNMVVLKNNIIDGCALPLAIAGKSENKLKVHLGNQHISDAAGAAFADMSFAEIYIDGGYWEFADTATSAARMFNINEEAQVYLENLPVYDCRKSNQTDMRIANFGHATARLEGKIKILEGSPAKISSYVEFNDHNAYADIEVIKDDGTVFPAFSNVGTSGVTWLKGRYATIKNPAYDEITYTTTGNKDLSLGTDSDNVVIRRIKTDAEGVAINSISAGREIGQILVIINRDNSTNNLIINPNSSGLISISSHIVLAKGRSCILIWNGSTWYCAIMDGQTRSSYNNGTKSSGTFTPNPAFGFMQHAVNGGTHTLAPPTSECSISMEYLNNASAGAITTSGFTKVTGSFNTTNGNKFLARIARTKNYSYLEIIALQ